MKSEMSCHELAHSMHFRKVGYGYWDNYIDGIIGCWFKSKNDIYGTSSTTHPYSGYIGVGETFGYAMGYYMANKKCYPSKKQDYPNKTSRYYWFKPIVTYDLLNNNTLTPLQFLDCMDRNTTDLTKLGEKLHQKYPSIPSNLYTK